MSLALDVYPQQEEGCFCFCSRPNCSMTPRQRRIAFGIIAGATLVIASAFGLIGAWMILPFAGIEIGVLAWAFDVVGRRSRDYESVSIRGDEIVVQRKQGELLESRTFNRHWAQLVTVEAGWGRSIKLALRSHGRETELGLFLTDEGRLEMARELRLWLKANV